MTYDEIVQDLAERLWAKSEQRGECIIWNGSASGQREYGVIGWMGRQVYIHRLIYSLHNPLEVLDIIRHTCDTPRCWNIDHLLNGSTQDNVDDKVAKNRHLFGSACHNTILREEDILRIRFDNRKLREIAADYGVNLATISYIKVGKTWKHVA